MALGLRFRLGPIAWYSRPKSGHQLGLISGALYACLWLIVNTTMASWWFVKVLAIGTAWVALTAWKSLAGRSAGRHSTV